MYNKKISFWLEKLIYIILCLVTILSLVSYDALDNCLNVSSNRQVENFLGQFGAYISDILLQIFGYASYYISICFLCWALFSHGRYFFGFKLRILLLAISTSFLSLYFASSISSLVKFSFSKYYLLPLLPVILYFSAGLPVSFKWVKRINISSIKNTKKEKKQKVSNINSKSIKRNGSFILPSLNLLHSHNSQSKGSISSAISDEDLLNTLNDFGVKGKIIASNEGPVVTLYEFEPAAGTKSSRVIGLSDDIARSLSAVSTRISSVPGKNVLGIEMPNKQRMFFGLKELLKTKEYEDPSIALPIVLGKKIDGSAFIADLAKMPHLLVAGTTGSGKSVAINSMILSLLYRYGPEECKFIMIDPKMLELSIYDKIPHLLTPVVTEPHKATAALKWAVREMEDRYRKMSNANVRNISNYNAKIKSSLDKGSDLKKKLQTGFDSKTGVPQYKTVTLASKPLPYIVVIVDEMADLMLTAGKEIEASIQRLAQMARAAGIHIIMATQRPSVDVITGVIKANFPSRVSFKVTSKIDSRTILGSMGSEQLLGMGDMLYMGSGAHITRAHGPFVEDTEVEEITNYLRAQGEPEYLSNITEEVEDAAEVDLGFNEDANDDESLYRKAVEVVLKDKKPSISYVQRSLRIGYNRAAILIERMEKEGVISEAGHSGKRQILSD